ncbi:AAA family ATPase [Shewanella sp. AS1]|uniref:AAA family ATPase n=1 Tax=Shewanella sp. AS1 TaxID=2907626 RepID=UPI001F3D5D11|nr:AAA family ATPase [Shewanella sp. AS1]MCE9680223.1 AAA family ATPase [Shewanella sp. AS1]
MTIKTSTLLPSQESLLHRLQHVALYGQQLTVLTGESGAGKTTLVTALVDGLEGVSTALVACPQHAQSSEIRRKILVQLLADPLFDDELPLPETLLDLTDSLPAHCHIVLDDAHYLPLTIWAECIVLSQLELSGKQISFTFTTSSGFLSEILTQLPEVQQQIMLPVNIAPLVVSEREMLYYSLLWRSEQVPFTPKEIVQQQLSMQQGLPGEVVKLLYLALEGEEEEIKSKPNYLWVYLAAALLFLLAVIVYFDSEPSAPQASRAHTVASLKASIANYAYGEAVLAPYFMARLDRVQAVEDAQSPSDIENLTEGTDLAQHTVGESEFPKLKPEELTQNIPVSEENAQASKAEVFAANAQAKMAEAQIANSNTAEPISTEPQITEPQITEASQLSSQAVGDNSSETVAANSNPVDSSHKLDDKSGQFNTFHPTSGYTIQLISVAKVESLIVLIERFDSIEQVKIAKYNQQWVAFYGQFDSRAQAQAQIKGLQESLDLGSLWIRKWAELSKYQLQQTVPSREI